MSADSITNFIESIETVINWARDALQDDGYWNRVERIDNYSWDEVYKVLAYAQVPSCVVVYKGGRYQNQPRAKRSFSVFVAEREWRNKNDAERRMSEIVDKVIGILDHELALDSDGVATTALVRVVSDTYIPLKWSGVTAYEIAFEVEDY